MTNPKISVVIPCYKTVGRVERLVSTISDALEPQVDKAFEIILVVDGSPDSTWTEVQTVAAANPAQVRGINLMRNYGQQAATLAGVTHAHGDIIVTMDDDFQHSAQDISVLIDKLNQGFDLVYGVTAVEEHGFFRNTTSRMFKWTMESVLKIENYSIASAFRVFRRELTNGFDASHDPFAPIDVLLSWATNNVSSAQVHMKEREDGVSNYSLRSLIRHAMNSITGYSTFPLRLVTLLGLSTFVVSFTLAIMMLVRSLLGQITVAGYPSLAIMVSLFAAVQLLSLGVIGEYLGRLHVRSMGKPRYVIRNDSDTSK